MKPGHTGLRRILHATRYSLAGLRFAYRFESAFRQEVWLGVVAVPLGLWVGTSAAERFMLVGSVLLVLLTELLNTAIEAVVDRIGDEYHSLSECAKDAGSAAVFMSLLLLGLAWGLVLWERYWPLI